MRWTFEGSALHSLLQYFCVFCVFRVTETCRETLYKKSLRGGEMFTSLIKDKKVQ